MDITEVPALLVDSNAEAVMFENYEATPKAYRFLTRQIPVGLTNRYGQKGTVMEGAGRFKKRQDKEEIEADNPGQGPTWYHQINSFGRRLELPERLIKGSTKGQIANLVLEFAQSYGETAGLGKDDIVAGMFENGMLTAGSLEHFDGSHPGNADPYPKFVYDNKPWFATDHPLSGQGVTTTIDNYDATLPLTSGNLQTVLTAFRNNMSINERGDRVDVRPRRLIVPAELEFTARTILESVNAPGGSNNDVNVVKGSLELVVWDALTDASAWYVTTADAGVNTYDEPPELSLAWDDKTATWNLIAKMDFGSGVANIRGAYAANKAAS